MYCFQSQNSAEVRTRMRANTCRSRTSVKAQQLPQEYPRFQCLYWFQVGRRVLAYIAGNLFFQSVNCRPNHWTTESRDSAGSSPMVWSAESPDSAVKWFGQQLTKDTSRVQSPIETRMKKNGKSLLRQTLRFIAVYCRAWQGGSPRAHCRYQKRG